MVVYSDVIDVSGGQSPRHTDMWLYTMMCLILQVTSRRVIQIMVVSYDVFDFSGGQSSCRTDMWLYTHTIKYSSQV